MSSCIDMQTQARLVVWRSGSVVRRINEVSLLCARLVLGWVTVYRWVYHLCKHNQVN